MEGLHNNAVRSGDVCDGTLQQCEDVRERGRIAETEVQVQCAKGGISSKTEPDYPGRWYGQELQNHPGEQ